ncbi:MAG TPA: N(G),N(G)-dimethylarginine dimethylaminohydrolase [Acidimicrobiales bacterium]|nr:N(G),N(G)-dimethylarginine dimethylaminohydrolase [Acidimicrobiales bacterium]
MASKKALVRPASPRLADGIVTHIERQPLDYHLALKQWEGYVEAMEGSGWEIVEVPPADECPDGAFVEDAVVAFRNVAVLSRPGADSRRPEVAGIEETMEALGCSLNRIRPPGTLDGGDVLRIGDTIYVGSGGRTNADGLRQLSNILGPLGATVLAVPGPLRKVLHLKSAVTALPDGTVIGYPPLVDDPGFFSPFLAVPEESGAHVVDLGANKILMAADCPRSHELFTDLGYQVVTADISEFQKLEGCVTCLSVRLRELSREPL